MRWDSSQLYTNGVLRITADGGPLLSGPALNYPNPFRRSQTTTVGYRLNRDADIEFRLYTSQGYEIYRTSFAAGSPGGTVGFNQIPISSTLFGQNLDVGVYMFVLINEGSIVAKNKMAVLP
jgi:hypothetical protein